MPNPCGTVHMPNFPCRECDRVRKNAEKIATHVQVSSRPDDAPDESPTQDLAEIVDETPSKAERIETVKQALTRTEISRRHREKDPEEYRRRNRERMARKREK